MRRLPTLPSRARFGGAPYSSTVAECTPRIDIGRVSHPRSSRQRYRAFVEDFRHRRLDEAALPSGNGTPKGPPRDKRDTRRQYVREYLRWLRPHRYAVAGVFALALVVAGLQMIEPLFMRFIDRVLLNQSLDSAARLRCTVSCAFAADEGEYEFIVALYALRVVSPV